MQCSSRFLKWLNGMNVMSTLGLAVGKPQWNVVVESAVRPMDSWSKYRLCWNNSVCGFWFCGVCLKSIVYYSALKAHYEVHKNIFRVHQYSCNAFFIIPKLEKWDFMLKIHYGPNKSCERFRVLPFSTHNNTHASHGAIQPWKILAMGNSEVSICS